MEPSLARSPPRCTIRGEFPPMLARSSYLPYVCSVIPILPHLAYIPHAYIFTDTRPPFLSLCHLYATLLYPTRHHTPTRRDCACVSTYRHSRHPFPYDLTRPSTPTHVTHTANCSSAVSHGTLQMVYRFTHMESNPFLTDTLVIPAFLSEQKV